MGATSVGGLVGRLVELAALGRALDAAAGGRGALVALAGEAGIGKTRLAEECVALASDLGFRTAWGSGWPEGGVPPLWPWQEVLEQVGADDAAALLDLGSDAATSGEQFGRFRAVAAALKRASARAPLLVVLDDAQAADAGALHLARFALRSLRTSPVLFVVTYRLDDVGPDTAEAVEELVREGSSLELAGLDDAAVGELLEAAGRTPSAELTGRLLELTNGNPLLVREALAVGAVGFAPVPDRIRRLLVTRLRAFDDEARRILAAAAVLGAATDAATVAAVADVDVGQVRAVRELARGGGLLRRDPGSRFAFAHGLLREALLAELDPDALAALQRRAADELGSPEAGGATVEQLCRIANLRLGAATRLGGVDVDRAVEATITAARADLGRFGYGSAAPLLRDACRLLDDGDRPPPPHLLVELGKAEFAAGRLRQARDVFDRALQHAGADDPVVLAEATVGLGGLSVFEHRTSEQVEAFGSLLAGAAAALGEERADLRTRIEARAAADAFFAGTGSVERVVEAVDAVRACGHPGALAESLSLLHHVLLGVAHAGTRRAVADELVALAPQAGDAVLSLMGHVWRTVDLFLDGDPQAIGALHDLRQRADALRVGSVLYVVELLDTMCLMRAGRLAEAEVAASRIFEHGIALGDADALGYYAGQLMCLRWLQDRTDEILPLAREALQASTIQRGDAIYAAGFAAVASRAGPAAREEARSELDRIAALGIGSIPMGSNWLVAMFCLAEAAAELGDAALALAVHDALLPYRHRPIMGSLGCLCLGPATRVLARCAATAGRVDEAVALLEEALEDGRRFGNRPLVAIARGDLGLLLLHGPDAGDRARGRALVAEAGAAMVVLGMDARADGLRQVLEASPRPVPPTGGAAPVAIDAGVDGVLRRAGTTWELVALGERAVVADTQGVRHLARLLRSPGKDIGADELAGGGSVVEGRQEVIDEKAKAAYHARIVELQADLDAADAKGDATRSTAVQAELDQLLAHLEGQLGLGGRARTFADGRERARTAVQKAIRRTIERIAEQAPAAGDALARSVSTGLVCRYEPAEGAPATWQVDAAD